MSEATLKQKVIGRLNALIMPRALDLLNLRIHHHDRSADPARPEYNEHVIFSFWHEYILVVLPRWGHTPTTVLCSQHRDGEWVNQTAESLGLHIVRGSSTRGGSAAIRQMKKNSKFSSLAITPDGPRGPRREMAMGPVYLASLLGMPLVPCGVGISNPYRLNTWDKFAIPRPNSRVRMIFGTKLYIPPKINRDQLEATRSDVQGIMNEMNDKAQWWADSREKLPGEQRFVRFHRESKVFFKEKPKRPAVFNPGEQAVSASPSSRRVG